MPLKNTSPSTALKDAGNFVCVYGLAEAKFEEEKHEIVLTALQEGAGNRRDMRWYSRACVEGLERLVYTRKKVFADHVLEGMKSSDSIKDWWATIKETWTEDVGGKLHRKIRLRVHEDWLWQRAKDAPEEIAVSIEGQGAGSEQVIEGEKFMVIEKIYHLNAFKFVPYPGNAKMGADVVEGASPLVEETIMIPKDLTLEQLKGERADLYAAAVAEGEARGKAEAAKLAEQAAANAAGDLNAQLVMVRESFKKQLDELKAASAATLKTLQEKAEAAEKKAEALEVRELLRAKRELVDRLLAESALVPEAKTDKFRSRLYAIVERREGDKVLSIEEQAKAEIAEMIHLTTANFGSVRESGATRPSAASAGDEVDLCKLTEEEERIAFVASANGRNAVDAVREHRAEKKAAEGK